MPVRLLDPMDLLSGFAWPVPRAFASAVSACRFESGDVLYDATSAYAAGEPESGPAYHIQILDPPRSARAAPADAGVDGFMTERSRLRSSSIYGSNTSTPACSRR